MASHSSWFGGPGSFPERREYRFAFQLFLGFLKKEKMGRSHKERGSIVKCRETPFEREGLVKIPSDSPCMMVLWELFNTFG